MKPKLVELPTNTNLLHFFETSDFERKGLCQVEVIRLAEGLARWS